MDNFVVSFSNNSNVSQEIDIFESSNLTGGGVTETVYSWSGNFADYGVPPVYNNTIGDQFWWYVTVLNQPGSIAVKFKTTTGTSVIFQVDNVATLQTLTTTQFESFLNTNPVLSEVGTWSVTDLSGGTGLFTISVIVDNDFATVNDIAINNPSFNYGAGSLKLYGGTGPFWASISVFPTVAQSSPALISNPNVSVVASNPNFSYSDFLWSTIGRTYDVKNFQLYSASKLQLLQPFLFDRTLATGRVYQKVLTPTIDPYQQQNYIVTPDEKGYILDGFTKIRYTLLPEQTIRIVLDYTFVDLSTPLIATLSRPNINDSDITPDFVSNMENGFDRFGCKFLQGRIVALNQKLEEVAGPSGNMHPKWQEQIKSRLMYIEQLMISYECITREEADEMPEFKVVGPELRRTNLFMPSPEFVQSQLDDEQGVRKLFRNHDFPIEKE
tara:strand:+ start:10506 stop:11825 length:1320 start_codon:yes stop_codon:yes gene_type:complete